jgi:ABC-type uncharacterized transport system permease subunit
VTARTKRILIAAPLAAIAFMGAVLVGTHQPRTLVTVLAGLALFILSAGILARARPQKKRLWERD